MQFIAEFIIESVQNLERICNEKAPPMDLKAINKNRADFTSATGNDEALARLRGDMKGMEDAFCERGDLEKWHPDLLEMIDKCFVNHYMHKGDPVPSLFFPDSKDNEIRFLRYCDGVDQALRLNASIAPKYAREYFSYYATWQLRGYGFPVPLGTATAVEALHALATRVSRGFTEVRIYSHVRWATCSSKPCMLASDVRPIESDKLRSVCNACVAILSPQAHAGLMAVDFMPTNAELTMHASGDLLAGDFGVLGTKNERESFHCP